jgi:hypothetical protein
MADAPSNIMLMLSRAAKATAAILKLVIAFLVVFLLREFAAQPEDSHAQDVRMLKTSFSYCLAGQAANGRDQPRPFARASIYPLH